MNKYAEFERNSSRGLRRRSVSAFAVDQSERLSVDGAHFDCRIVWYDRSLDYRQLPIKQLQIVVPGSPEGGDASLDRIAPIQTRPVPIILNGI
jgi:hypothetical protein